MLPTLIRRMSRAVGLLIVVGVAYVFYGYATAEGRIREVCSQIKPGMPVSELRALGTKHGLGPRPPNESGVNYMVETRTFGRYGCKVILEAGIVQSAEYNFAD